ncbi:hypothetical protein HmCmsJML039_03968 [Escherichia coli]|nr:hypothetical protein HmCmsJML039_02685 [Escherichia coli]GCU97150.1 hypothetical protein HmCmsJML039_03968 [Escherichia coli]
MLVMLVTDVTARENIVFHALTVLFIVFTAPVTLFISPVIAASVTVAVVVSV